MKRHLFLFLCLLLLMPIRCVAAENRGTIRLQMAYNGNAVAGGSVVLYNVTTCHGEMDPKELAAYVKKMGLPGEQKQIDSTGTVTFENLPSGIYLLIQKNSAEGYLAMKPFCISLPMSVNGQMMYEIDASPKLQPKDKLPQTGQIIWPAWAFIGFGLAFIGIGLSNLKRE